MHDLNKILNGEEKLPTDKEFWLELNDRLEAVGLPKLIITDDKVYKDDLHAYLGIGYELG